MLLQVVLAHSAIVADGLSGCFREFQIRKVIVSVQGVVDAVFSDFFFRCVMVMTSFVYCLLSGVMTIAPSAAHLSKSSPGVVFHPNLHPNQGFIRVHDIYYSCVNWCGKLTGLYRIAHYLQSSPTSSPVSRTRAETLVNQGFPPFF